VSDEAALLEKLEKVLDESRKLRVRLTLLQRQLDFYPLLSSPAPGLKPLPESAANSQIAKSTFKRQKPGAEGSGIFGGLRTVPPNPEPVRLLLPNDAPREDVVDQPELVAALAVGG
jgi:hypothetical protein